jgi:hypothetical protein
MLCDWKLSAGSGGRCVPDGLPTKNPEMGALAASKYPPDYLSATVHKCRIELSILTHAEYVE